MELARAKNGCAIHTSRKTRGEIRRLVAFLRKATKKGDLACWRRAKAVLGYIRGVSVKQLSEELMVTRGAINRWIQWFNVQGTEGLVTGISTGAPPKLNEAQKQELVTLIEAGPIEAGYQTGIWTGPMIGDLIRRKFGVKYHNHHIPRLLHSLGFSVQRPRRLLARADLEKQAKWLAKTFPTIKKKHVPAVGWFSSRMKPASGWMERSTKLGPVLGANHR
jgi:transposase